MEMVQQILELLSKRDETIAVAESCTGGGLANEITAVPGISKIFLGSITAYADSAKEAVLKVQKALIQQHGAVSEPVALLMAKNCRSLFGATWALSTTGIAGPAGGRLDKPVGLVFIGLSGPGILLAKKFIFPHASRLQHREQTIVEALAMLWTAHKQSNG